jgi:hypothetical protein
LIDFSVLKNVINDVWSITWERLEVVFWYLPYVLYVDRWPLIAKGRCLLMTTAHPSWWPSWIFFPSVISVNSGTIWAMSIAWPLCRILGIFPPCDSQRPLAIYKQRHHLRKNK